MRPRRLAAVIAAAALALVVAGGANAATGPQASELPDRWSGAWPSQLMPGAVQLGTLEWRPIRYADGMGLVGQSFGGAPFVGCPEDGDTRFFRGRYVKGGNLIACTKGADASTLVGRFDGNELFRSGSFEISLVPGTEKPFFMGLYVEDAGITTVWCGVLEKTFAFARAPANPPPSLAVEKPARLASGIVPLRFSVFGGDGRVGVEVVVRRAGSVVHRSTLTARPHGRATVVRWKAPPRARGTYTLCATARDASGRTARSCAPLRL